MLSIQILDIELPGTYENSIVMTQVETQMKKMKQFEQTSKLIKQEIDILRSRTTQDIQAINSTATAEAYKIVHRAIAKSNNFTIEAEADAYESVKQV